MMISKIRRFHERLTNQKPATLHQQHSIVSIENRFDNEYSQVESGLCTLKMKTHQKQILIQQLEDYRSFDESDKPISWCSLRRRMFEHIQVVVCLPLTGFTNPLGMDFEIIATATAAWLLRTLVSHSFSTSLAISWLEVDMRSVTFVFWTEMYSRD